ncbi:Microcystin dependent protein [Collimonas arenae]|uniref:Microcystin dependent protein n=1 Tax=Collimonas arenae TaxID=279058 RepID=A0A0A1FA26_9BURK|nr:tail fiber protein [Collimonas arenae]AIY41593.1 Microcystin dependent protein [Collimonas arenae]
MTTPYVGEIQIFGFNFAPVDWAQCNGALLPISQYSALFSLLGTNYGGNGQTNFQLPNFAGRTACSQGQGPGLTQRDIGEPFGVEEVTLTSAQIPSHSHAMNIYHQPDAASQKNVPDNGFGLMGPTGTSTYVPGNPTPNTTLAIPVIGVAGGSQPHENRQPLLALNFCIALQGVFPSFG